MKRFWELDADKQTMAHAFARKMVKDLLLQGVIIGDRELTHDHIEELADCMANDAWYSEKEDMIIADIADGK